MSYDIYDILKRYDSLNENIDAAQKSVKQLPALFKPKNTSPQLSGPYPGKNATLGYLVGEESETPQVNRGGYNALRDREDYLDKRDVLQKLLINPGTDSETREEARKRLGDLEKAARMSGIIREDEDNPMKNAVLGRIRRGRLDLIEKYGLDAVMDTVDDVVWDDDWEEIGSSDVSAYVKRVEDQLRDQHTSRDDIAESHTTEDVISTMKKKLGDYLQDVATAIKTDPDLKDKIPQELDQIKAVKTITTDDGHEIKIHGNEDDGFRVTIKNKEAKSKFSDLDEAVMAVEMYCSRRKVTQENADYVEEKR